MSKRVLVLGLNPSWQKSLFFSKLLFHEVNRAGKVHSMPSGKGINFVRAARIWNKVSSIVLQPVGGYTGDMLCGALRAEQLPEISVPTAVPTRICSTLICEKTKTITEIIEPSGKLSDEDVNTLKDRAAELLDGSDALAACGTFPPGITPDFYASFIRKAHEKGLPVIVDAYKEIIPSLEAGTDYFKINGEELAALSGSPDIINGLKIMYGRYSLKALAVTSGPDSAFLIGPAGIFRYSIPQLENFINPIGAGDTCTAVMFSELLQGNSCEEAFAWGLAAASASCETPYPAIFAKANAEKLFSKIKIEKIGS